MTSKYVLIIAFTLLSLKQAQGYTIPDSLRHKDYDYMFDRIESPDISSKEKSVYLKSFLLKAKSDKNWEELANAYKNYVYHAPEADRLMYADSMVLAAKQSKDDALIGSAYLSKGIAYVIQRRFNEALDFYLLADKYITKTNDDYLRYKAMYSIGHIKYYLGYYDEAISLLKTCITYMKGSDNRGYLNSLHSLGLCHSKEGNHGLCSQVNATGLLECQRLGIPEMIPYFILSDGTNQCDIANYKVAVDKLTKALAGLPDKDFANRAVAHFYIGKSYWHLGQKNKAKSYFEKVHLSYLKNGYLLPYLREAYEMMITYYKERNDLKAQLYYVDALLELDRELALTFRYLVSKIHKEYDTRELLSQKKSIEDSLERRKYNDYIFLAAICALCLVIFCLVLRYIRTRRKFREKYEELVLRLEASKKEKVPFTEEEVLSVSQDAADHILQQLEKFESSKKYVDRDLNQMKLAVLFGTNTTYLSKVIAHHRNTKFNDYINDLKVDNIAQRIKEERLLRKYNNKALAEEAGFSTTRRFVIAFEARTGISPTYFIEELTKDELSIGKEVVAAECAT